MKLTLIKTQKEAKGTKSFYFKPDRPFSFLPGQYLYLTLPKLNFPDSRGETRHFTISASPTEKLLCVTTRIREQSGYKKTLDSLSEGTVLKAEGPNGTFILDEHEVGKHVFLAGGIGITPFKSFLKYSFDKNLENSFELLYSNSATNEITFEDELVSWQKDNKNFSVVFTVTKPENSKKEWSGETGRIDAEFIKKHIKDIHSKTFWVVGPPPMVSAMEEALDKLKVSGAQVRSEKFTGY